MKKIFLDTNVILDVILDRRGSIEGRQILQLGEDRQIRNCTSVLSFANVSYVIHKYLSRNEQYEVLNALFDCVSILSMGDQLVFDALMKKCSDFEDSLQIECARLSVCDCIITNDRKHFKATPIPVYTPEEFLQAVGR